MTNYLKFVALTAALLFCSAAYAQNGVNTKSIFPTKPSFYAEGAGGISSRIPSQPTVSAAPIELHPEVQHEIGPAGAIEVGGDFGPVRLGVGAFGAMNDLDYARVIAINTPGGQFPGPNMELDGSLTFVCGTGNVGVDFEVTKNFEPFIKAAAGYCPYANLQLSSGMDETDSFFVGRVGAGARYYLGTERKFYFFGEADYWQALDTLEFTGATPIGAGKVTVRPRGVMGLLGFGMSF